MTERDAFGNPIAPSAPAASPPPQPQPLAQPGQEPAPHYVVPVPTAHDPKRDDGDGLGWAALAVSVVGFFFLPIVSSIGGIMLGRRAKQEGGGGTPAALGIGFGWAGLVLWALVAVLFVVGVAAG